MEEKIGIALITYNRYDYFKQVVESLVTHDYGGADTLVIVQDGNYYSKEQWQVIEQLLYTQPINYTIIIHEQNRGVAATKNTGIKQLQTEEVTHFFTLEDDILLTNNNTAIEYVEYAKKTGIKHLNFALHGEMNKGKKKLYHGQPAYPHCVGAWSYYHKECFQKIGLFNEKMINAYEHVYHTLQLANQGLTTPFWIFIDHPKNDQLLKEIPGSIENSSIRPRKDWKKNIEQAQQTMIEETGTFLPPTHPLWKQ